MWTAGGFPHKEFSLRGAKFDSEIEAVWNENGRVLERVNLVIDHFAESNHSYQYTESGNIQIISRVKLQLQ